MNAVELGKIRDILAKQGVVPATASDGDVAAAHAALLGSSQAVEYANLLQQNGVSTGPNWLTLIGLAGGVVALYFIWKHYQKEKVTEFNRPDPVEQRHQLRGMSRALGSFRNMGGSKSCGPRGMGRFGAAKAEKYEFEPERRLEGYRRKARRA